MQVLARLCRLCLAEVVGGPGIDVLRRCRGDSAPVPVDREGSTSCILQRVISVRPYSLTNASVLLLA